jgi:hypothetical protein
VIDEVEGLSLCIGLLAMVNALLAFLLLASGDGGNAVSAAVVVGGLSLAGGYALGSRSKRK